MPKICWDTDFRRSSQMNNFKFHPRRKERSLQEMKSLKL